MSKFVIGLAGIALASGTSFGAFADFDAETEGFKGASFTSSGITFYGVNGNSGMNPDGSVFEPGDFGTDLIVENATLAYNDFPDVLSPFNTLGFGRSFVPGDSLTINLVTEVHMTTGQVETAASLDLLYYENGPWGGIIVRLDAIKDGSVVGGDSFQISDLGGRDNLITGELSFSGVEFDTLRLHAIYPDNTPTLFASIIDNVSITPAPGVAMLAPMALAGLGRRRR